MGGLSNINNQLAQVHQNIKNGMTPQNPVMPPAPVVIH